jgi:arsenate reductase
MFPELLNTIEKFKGGDLLISANRKIQLQELAKLINEFDDRGEDVLVNFVCTHNSRRSQIAEVWMRTALKYYGKTNIVSCSSGTEATAFNPNAIAALVKAGFQATIMEDGSNPRYLLSYGIDDETIPMMFSTTIADFQKEGKNFLAVMVCSDADENCPFVPGMKRFSLNYEDPKVADDRSDQAAVYYNKVMEIGNEMFYLAGLL